MVPNGSRSLVACIAAVASGGGRGDDFHNFFDPAHVDGIVPGKIGRILGSDGRYLRNLAMEQVRHFGDGLLMDLTTSN